VDGTFSELCPVVDLGVLLTVLENHELPLPQSTVKCVLAVSVVIYLFQLHACEERLTDEA
jgi:hypothetical protein